jgi:uncharacterized protein DUF4412
MAGRAIRQVMYALMALWAMSTWFPLDAWAGWIIEQIEYANAGAEGTKTIQYISKNRLKTEGDGHTFIMDFPKNLFTATDQENKVYWSGTVDEYVQEVQRFQRAANDLAQQQMREAMKEMPPDQRKAMEDILQQMHGVSAPPQAPPLAKRPTVKAEPAAETAMIAGYKASKITVYADGKPYQEVWLVKDVSLKDDLDLKQMRALQAKLTQAIMTDMPSRQTVEEDPVYTAMLEQGYPAKIVELGEHGEPEAATEVVRIEKRDLPDRAFQPPEGYRRIELRQFFQEELDKLKKGG